MFNHPPYQAMTNDKETFISLWSGSQDTHVQCSTY